jgi:spoIIIJ-associated protein
MHICWIKTEERRRISKMNEWKEFSAKTVEDALTEASIQLEVTSDMVEYEVIEAQKSGFLGIFSKPAKIRARKKEETSSEEKIKKESPIVSKKEDKKENEVTGISRASHSSSDYEEKKKRPEIDGELVEKAAKDFLEEVFKAMKIEAKVSSTYNSVLGQVDVDIEGEDMGILIGKRGQTLDSLQYLTSLVVNKKSSSFLKVKVDTENYRERRRETLENLAKNISYKVKRTKRPVSLEPMNPYERRVIHSALQNDKYVETHSEGDEPYRRVVVTLKKNYNSYNNSNSYNNNYNNRNYQGNGRNYYNNNRGGYRRNFTEESSFAEENVEE